MIDRNTSLLNLEIDPLKQAAGTLLLAVLFILLLKGLNYLVPIQGNISYLSLSAFFLFFILVNCILSFSSKSYIKYQLRSILAMFALIALNFMVGYILTGKTVFEVGSYSTIYVVLIVCFFVFTGIVSTVLTVVEWSKTHKSKIQKREEK
jgi:hypothetical protein